MRSIGCLQTQESAALFSDYLASKGVENELESHKDGSWTIWVLNEDQVESSKKIFERFEQNPLDAEFDLKAVQSRLKDQQKEEVESGRTRIFTREDIWPASRMAYVTMALILASCAVSFFSDFGAAAWAKALFISESSLPAGASWLQAFPEARQGQLWRLITPIFLHFGFIHLLFNMMWLKDLGGAIEQRKGPVLLAVMVVVMAVFSNSAEYLLSTSRFGGMSGVVYGLLGYIWMKGKYDPACGLRLHSSTVTMMIAWFVLGFTGLLWAPVANMVHAGGLVAGVVWGFLSSRGVRPPPQR